jgi:hemin uptake protein HemP
MNDVLPPTGNAPDQATGQETGTPAERDTARVIRSEELFAGERIVHIQHAGETYRLLVTRNDRLILQK